MTMVKILETMEMELVLLRNHARKHVDVHVHQNAFMISTAKVEGIRRDQEVDLVVRAHLLIPARVLPHLLLIPARLQVIRADQEVLAIRRNLDHLLRGVLLISIFPAHHLALQDHPIKSTNPDVEVQDHLRLPVIPANQAVALPVIPAAPRALPVDHLPQVIRAAVLRRPARANRLIAARKFVLPS